MFLCIDTRYGVYTRKSSSGSFFIVDIIFKVVDWQQQPDPSTSTKKAAILESVLNHMSA